MRRFNRRVIVCIFIFIAAPALMAEEEQTAFHLSTSPGIIIGSGFEYVLKYGLTKSRLDWPLLPVGSITANTEFKLKNGFYISFFSSFMIPAYSGQMFDRDYLNPSSPYMLTKFSEHKSYIKQGVDLGFNLGWIKSLVSYTTSANKKLKIYCGPSLNVRYILNSWDAVDGYVKYPPETNPPSPVLPDTPTIPMTGVGVSYKQSFILPGIGILFMFELPRYWKIDLAMHLCPNALGVAEDFHYMRENGGLRFVDTFENKNVSFYLYLSAKKRLSKYFSFMSSVDFTSITAYNGKTFVYFLKSGLLKEEASTGSAGAALHYSRINFGIMLHILK